MHKNVVYCDKERRDNMSIALITGASGGIGSAAAERLAAAGRDICAGYCNSKESAETLCRRLRSEYGVRAEAVRLCERGNRSHRSTDVHKHRSGDTRQEYQ